MYVLGIHASFNSLNHDPSACLFKNGKILGAIEEERFNRVKTSLGFFPYKSVDFLLKKYKLNIDDISVVATTGVTVKNIKNKVKSFFLHAYNYSPKIEVFSHPMAHAAGAYYSSGYKNALIFSVDGWGDGVGTLICRGSNGKIKKIYSNTYRNNLESIGNFYATFTEFLGFTQCEGEFKMMGMAAYGKENKVSVNKFVKLKEKPFQILFDKNLYTKWKTTSVFQPFTNYKYLNKFFLSRPSLKNKFSQKHFNLAKSVQSKFEEIINLLVKKFKKKNDINLAYAGGCALNCLANRNLDKVFQGTYIMPAASDRGLCIGAAYLSFRKRFKKVYPIKNMFLGKSYNNVEIKKILDSYKVRYKKCDSNVMAAQDLIDGKVVGWFKGRSEFGPRALGARSILALPNIKGMKKKINSKIKFREKFRPFAPAMLYSFAKKYGIKKKYPNMTIAIKINKNLKSKINETVHKDGTARIQTVNEKSHPFFKLLKVLEKKGYDPVMINTSFNLSGEPVVLSPIDAIKTFISSGIDSLYIENFKIYKN